MSTLDQLIKQEMAEHSIAFDKFIRCNRTPIKYRHMKPAKGYPRDRVMTKLLQVQLEKQFREETFTYMDEISDMTDDQIDALSAKLRGETL